MEESNRIEQRTVLLSLVGVGFGSKPVSQLDELRERIGRVVERPVESSWVNISFTADPRWA